MTKLEVERVSAPGCSLSVEIMEIGLAYHNLGTKTLKIKCKIFLPGLDTFPVEPVHGLLGYILDEG